MAPAETWVEDAAIWAVEPDGSRLSAALTLKAADATAAFQEYHALAALGSVISLGCIANALVGGTGVEANPAPAEEYYRRAMSHGLASAYFNLASFYWKQRDFGQTEPLLVIGAANHHIRSCYALGRLYAWHTDTGDRFEKAARLFREAYAAGHLQSGMALARLMAKGHLGFFERFRAFGLSYRTLMIVAKVWKENPSSNRLVDLPKKYLPSPAPPPRGK